MAGFYTYGEVPTTDPEGGSEEVERGFIAQMLEEQEASRQRQADLFEMQRRQEEIAAARAEEESRRVLAERIAEERAREDMIRQAEAEQAAESARAEAARAQAASEEAARAEAARAEAARVIAEREAARVAAEREAARIAAEESARKQPASVSSPLSDAVSSEDSRVPSGALSDANAMQESYALLTQADAARMEPISALNFALDFGGGGGGGLPTIIEKSLYAPEETDAEKAMREEIAKSYVAPQKAPEVSTAEVAKMSGLSEEDLTAAQKQISEPYLERNAILSEIGDRLKANDFKGAFDVALKAEQEGKGMFFENIIDPDKMRYLRGPMTADEMRKFYAELPQEEYLKRYGDRSDFISERALEKNLAELGGKAGFADPRAGLKAKESVITDAIKFATKYGLDVIMAASGIPPTAAALTKAAQTYAETGGNMEAVLKAAAATYVGTSVGQKVGDLIPSSSAVSKAAESAVEKAATQGVAAGLTGDALAEVVVRAAAEQGLGSAVTGTLVSKAIDNALRSQAEAGLEQIEVSTFKPNLEKALASTVTTGGVQDILSERQIEEAKEAEQKAEEELEEIKVTGKKPFDPALTLGTPDISKETKTDLSEKATESKSPLSEEELEEIKVTGKKAQSGEITAPLSTLVDEEPFIEAPTVDGQQQITVESKKTSPSERPPVVIPDVNVPKETPVDLGTETTKINQPPAEEEDPLKGMLDKLGGLEELLKLLAAFGATSGGGSKPKGPLTTATKDTEFGGALPKYKYVRKSITPTTEAKTYGFRPEEQYFEYVLEEEKPPEEKKDGLAKGGLAGYAKGGSKKSRYVDGPGSGRDDKIPALLSDGEYVIDAETLALLGDGSTREGARRMDKFRANIRKHKGRALSRGQISPDAKSPDKYMGGGLA